MILKPHDHITSTSWTLLDATTFNTEELTISSTFWHLWKFVEVLNAVALLGTHLLTPSKRWQMSTSSWKRSLSPNQLVNFLIWDHHPASVSSQHALCPCLSILALIRSPSAKHFHSSATKSVTSRVSSGDSTWFSACSSLWTSSPIQNALVSMALCLPSLPFGRERWGRNTQLLWKPTRTVWRRHWANWVSPISNAFLNWGEKIIKNCQSVSEPHKHCPGVTIYSDLKGV